MKIDISAKLYKKIKGFCEINGLKVSEFCEEKLNDAIMIEQYGDTPFTSYDDAATIEVPEPKEEETPRFANLMFNDEGKLVPAPWSAAYTPIETGTSMVTSASTEINEEYFEKAEVIKENIQVVETPSFEEKPKVAKKKTRRLK